MVEKGCPEEEYRNWMDKWIHRIEDSDPLIVEAHQYDLGILLQFKLIYAIDRQICKAGLNLKRILRLSDCINFIKSLYEHLFEFNSSHLLVLCESVNICPFCIVKEDPQA
ncbi:hypothetical protein C4D60_Mb04t08950 [Musa balbisiana]|uniref:Uncharacterized protein n=1 Tax=Musa balbisiana TaxID=52838 RepID=A0A4S8KAR7_MUSBA|nr:hypothetical protein C4D60_Mb04t08950 [Musa balbisiana]